MNACVVLDFTKDDENVNSQPFMRWRQRFDFVQEAIEKAERETVERKATTWNVTAPTPERCTSAPSTRRTRLPMHMHDYLTGGLCANTGLANWCRDNGMLLHIHRASRRARPQPAPRHPLPRADQGAGGSQVVTTCTLGRWWASSKATARPRWLDRHHARQLHQGRPFARHLLRPGFGSMPGVMPVASGGIHVWHMPALVNIFGDDSVLQFGGGTLGHPWGNAAGAAANRVALEACVKARNEGTAVEKEGKTVLMDAAKHSPELKIARKPGKRSSSSLTRWTSSTSPTSDSVEFDP
ncbi:MAG: RuBisCO large subunit C-terminal-like domain-containing protein [Burkholderiaceae bacterium]